MKPNVIFAIFKRNFLSYFASPTGYVFICVFVVACSWAAFWPNNFFDLNLANLDQLNSKMPWILLVFIPAITMSIWADERRQGTDELLLTIPAGDFDVVLGKYLAAVAIYSVSLSFSLFCNYFVLLSLAWPEGPDPGLFVATYFGYWLMGLSMLAVGMASSFFTNNLTVAFILGVLLNVPLVFLNYFDVVLPTENVNRWLAENLTWLTNNASRLADTLVPADLGERIKGWSLESQFLDFGRGMISLGGLVYFSLIAAVMLYLCMVLIGRRHWQGGRAGVSYGMHYLTRFVSLAILAWGLVVIFHRFDIRQDITSAQISSLSSATRELIRNLDKPVRIEAYISPQVPESYVQTRANLISALAEFQAVGRKNITLRIHDTEPLSEQAEQAEQQYGIKSEQVESRDRGKQNVENIYMGVAIVSGLEKVVVPFFGRQLPVEYELARSIATVGEVSKTSDGKKNEMKRKKLGVLNTDVALMGGRDEALVDELKKQYDVVQVSADAPITETYDVLLAVQPSSLGPEQMEHFISCVKRGQPTAIFEDPLSVYFQVAGTNVPKQGPRHPQFGFPQPGQPKGNIAPLWSLLGVQFSSDHVVWQDHNPYPKLEHLPKEFVFLDTQASGDPDRPVFNPKDEISKDLKEIAFPFPGYITAVDVGGLKFDELIETGPDTGTRLVTELMGPNRNSQYPRTRKTYYVLAAHIHGASKAAKPMSDADPDSSKGQATASDDKAPTEKQEAEQPKKDADKKSGDKKSSDKKESPAEPKINVVLVADIDLLYAMFFQIRSLGLPTQDLENIKFDNVTFLLNVLDELAGDDRFIEIRGRRREHRKLTQIDERTATARDEASRKTQEFVDKYTKAIAAEQKKYDESLEKIAKRTDIDEDQKDQQREQMAVLGTQRLQVTGKQLLMARDKEERRINRELATSIRKVQDWYKMWAIVLPPILPMLIGVAVFYNRRASEREGVSKSRLRRGAEG